MTNQIAVLSARRGEEEIMPKYRVWACLEGEDIVEADNEDEAFVQLSDDLMSGGSWQMRVEEIEDEEETNDSD